MNVLFTSVGRRVELMRAFREAGQRLGMECNIIATDIDPLAPALQEADRFHMVPRFSRPDYIPRLLEICRNERVDAVCPLIDPDIPLLSMSRHEFVKVGAQVLAVDPAAAEIGADKWRTSGFFRNIGLPSPQSWLPGELDPAQHDYPRFIKPRRGSAAIDAYKVNNADELRFFEKYVPDSIIQEYVPGIEITSDILADLEGKVLAVVSRQRIAIRGGEVAKGVTVFDPRVAEACEEIAQALPARGPITAQCIVRDGVPHFIEVNARLGGGIPLAIAAGVDVPAILLRILAGQAVEPVERGDYQIGLHMTRFDDSFFIPSQKVAGSARSSL